MWRILPALRPVGEVLTVCRAAVSVSPGSLPVVTHALAAWTLVAVAWIVITAGALLLLRAVCLDPFDREEDESDDQVSGHVPS